MRDAVASKTRRGRRDQVPQTSDQAVRPRSRAVIGQAIVNRRPTTSRGVVRTRQRYPRWMLMQAQKAVMTKERGGPGDGAGSERRLGTSRRGSTEMSKSTGDAHGTTHCTAAPPVARSAHGACSKHRSTGIASRRSAIDRFSTPTTRWPMPSSGRRTTAAWSRRRRATPARSK